MDKRLIVVLLAVTSYGCGGGPASPGTAALVSKPPHGIVFIGDSITAFQNLSTNYKEVPIYNEGVMMQTCAVIHQRFAAALDSHPDTDTVVLECGTNDLFVYGLTTDEAITEITAMVSIATAKGKRIILETMPPEFTGGPIVGRTDADVTALILNVDTRLLSLGVEVADCNKVLSGTDGKAISGILTDGVHPSSAGYQLMSVEVERVLNQPR